MRQQEPQVAQGEVEVGYWRKFLHQNGCPTSTGAVVEPIYIYTFSPLLALKVFTAVFSLASQTSHPLVSFCVNELISWQCPEPSSVPWAVPQPGGCRERGLCTQHQGCPRRGAVLLSHPTARAGFVLQMQTQLG